jgi:transcriptional regulator with XRE-family HTH domain
VTTERPSDNSEWVELGRRLRETREYLNLSQQYVADRTGIPRSAISDVERGVRKVDSLEIKKLSKLYVFPVSYLLGEDEPDEGVRALARAVTDLTDHDRAEVLRYAQFLRFSAASQKRQQRR